MTHHPFHVAVREQEAVTEFAVVDGPTRHWLHGHISPGPDGVWVNYSWARRESVNWYTRPGGDPALAIFEMLNQWINAMVGRDPGYQPPLPVFFAPSPSMLDYFDDAFQRAGMPPRFVRDTIDHPPVEPLHDALAYVHANEASIRP